MTITDADLDHLRNINTSPGPNAGRSIDPTRPGPDADRASPEPQDVRERFARALYFASEGLAPESWFISENDAHWEQWKNDGDYMSPSALSVADALIAAFPALAQSDAGPDRSVHGELIPDCPTDGVAARQGNGG